MTWDSLVYLLGVYWPFLSVAAVIGLGTGWLSYAAPKP